MKRVHLQWNGTETYRGADQFLNESITCESGEKVAVSEQKAAELLKENGTGDLWKRIEPETEKKPSGGALSTQNTQ